MKERQGREHDIVLVQFADWRPARCGHPQQAVLGQHDALGSTGCARCIYEECRGMQIGGVAGSAGRRGGAQLAACLNRPVLVHVTKEAGLGLSQKKASDVPVGGAQPEKKYADAKKDALRYPGRQFWWKTARLTKGKKETAAH